MQNLQFQTSFCEFVVLLYFGYCLFLNQNFQDIDVRASVNMEIGTTEGLDYVAECFDSFYAKRECNRDFKQLKKLRSWCDNNGKKLYGLANSGCLNYCSTHTFHDNLVAHESEIAEMDNAYQFEGQCRRFLKDIENREKWFSISNFIISIICVCFLPALIEELFFRGLITAGLKSKNKFLSVIISGALFSIFHMAPNQTLYQFVAGCVFALIVLKGGNFYITFIFHFINNLLIVIFYYFKITYPTLIFTILGLFSLFIGIFILSTNKIKGEKIKDNSSFLKTGVYGIVLCLFMWIVNLFSYMVW